MTAVTIRITSDEQIALAQSIVGDIETDAGMEVVIRASRNTKSRGQESRYHAMLNDIATQCRHLNLALDLETWKRLCVDQFKRETTTEPECCAAYWKRHQLNVIPSLDRSAIIVLGEQTRKFPKDVASVFIEWLFAWGTEHSVIWRDAETEFYDLLDK